MDTFTTAHTNITILSNGKTVKSYGSNKYGFYNAYGSIGIRSSTKNKYKWRLKCKKRNAYMIIGIISNRDVNVDFNKIDYGYDGGNGCKYNLGKAEQYGITWGTGDMIEMSVDFGRQEIGYKVNGVEQGIAYQMNHRQFAIDKTYYLVVSMNTGKYNKGDSIILNDFIIINNEIECKEEKEKNEMNKLKKEKEELLEEITNQYEMMLNEAIDNQQNQKKQIKNLQQQLDDNNNTFKKEKQELTNKYEKKLKEAINNQRNFYEIRRKNYIYIHTQKKVQINNLKAEINKLLDEKKEMELEMNGLKEENERLNRNNLDYSSWRQWDSKKVFYFIINSVNDGSLKPYQKNIKKEIFESEYCGKDLVNIDINDIKSMGIKKISVRKAVFNAIQKLIQKKAQMEGIASNAPNAPIAYIYN